MSERVRGAGTAFYAGAAFLLSASPLIAQSRAVTARSIAAADNGNWEMPGKNYAATRFSAMRQVNPGNVGKLKVAFTFPTKINKGHEAPARGRLDDVYRHAPPE